MNHNDNGTVVLGAPNSYANSLQTGCGKRTHVSGTNGGTVPCGSPVKHLDGTRVIEYCAVCEDKRKLFYSPLKRAVTDTEKERG
jgi:hypothetical protein